ncbi:hypothetical protein CYLTODRAFT_453260 [Cylindrobasidium torrendii FP15055 ss-10]|uniref:Non-specific serine/threonine protein kinase n=1 Tax=Cylindrobasidium torrendii FP15055 ss-10 TaxID=1314674 RepID=A0A0D7BF15_9AGAR|nr:hypothetical protein CYLTODRAFT_453260 [Cylindrobasidium torrendii FP15055 ss-10]
MPFITKEESRKATNSTSVIRTGYVGVKSKGVFAGWIWKRRWVQLTETTLMFYKSENSARPCKTILTRDLSTVERTEMRPYCVLLQTSNRARSAAKTYLLSFDGDDELYAWQDDIYNRSSLGNVMSGPTGFVHHVHVGFDTGGFTGLPNEWDAAVAGAPVDEKARPLVAESGPNTAAPPQS